MFFKTFGFSMPHVWMDKSADNAEGGDTDADNVDADEDEKSGSDKNKTDKNSDSPQNKDNSNDANPVLEAIKSLTDILTASSKTANKDAKARRKENEKILTALANPERDADEDPSALTASQTALATATSLLQDSQKTLELEREARKLNFSSAQEAAKLALLLHPSKVDIGEDDGKQVITGAKEALEAIIETYPAMLKGAKKPDLSGEEEQNNGDGEVTREADIRSRMM